MTSQRWAIFGAGLVVLFLASVAAGAFVGQMTTGASGPVANASPTPSLTASPAVTPPPTTTPTPTPTPAPSPTPTSAPADTEPPDTLAAHGFAQELAAAIREGDAEYLFDHLHPATIERYGEQPCRDLVGGMGGDLNWEIVGSSGPEAWSYETDDLSTLVTDAWIVIVRQPGANPELRELHFARFEGTWRWFSDCGDPAGEATP